ncbi:MAG: glutamine--fructose-6-phosphate transaminase (isomerizing) [Clostridia bacterium]|nr:glutamine--fructose-6-phosphate transaminase (isomerizing) [Clostridia bacterium]
MCGIVGYVGSRPVVPVLLEGLHRLEYRGYDSAGIAVLNDNKLKVNKAKGKLAVLEEKLSQTHVASNIGIGHTRWATHGAPSDTNAHPHTDCSGTLAVVHNGIIENYQELKVKLLAEGHVFTSETDTEVLAHLIEKYLKERGSLLEAVRAAVEAVRGSYALAVISEAAPGEIVAARKDSPLVVGLNDGEYFLASDIPALLPYTRDTLLIDDGEVIRLSRGGAEVFGPDGLPVTKEIFRVKWDAKAAEREGWDHFMLKEIFEQPRALRDTLAGRLTPGEGGLGFLPSLEELGLEKDYINSLRQIHGVACGTAYHAAMVGKRLWEHLVGLPVEVDLASEFRYRDVPLLGPETLVTVVSQSGETADTLAALREAKGRGSRVLAITNVVGSSVSREADHVLYTWAGPEIAVASTKAYTTQLLALGLIGLYLAQIRCSRTFDRRELAWLGAELAEIPRKAQQTLDLSQQVRGLAQRIAQHQNAFFIGRGLDYAAALEGALKLKEISYIHAEAYAAGELKHGTLALIEEGVPVVCLVTQPHLAEKTISNIKEVKARGGWTIGVTVPEVESQVAEAVDEMLVLPQTAPQWVPILAVIPLQLLAYYAAVARGCDVDQPRNLAKSVTVE